MKVKSESEVAQSCLTLSDPMDCNLPGSSIHGIFQARVLGWVATAFSIRFKKSVLFVYVRVKSKVPSPVRANIKTFVSYFSSAICHAVMEEPGRLRSTGSLRVGHD